MKDTLPKILFFFAMASVVFGFGFLSGSMQFFPYQMIKEARIALVSLVELTEADDPAFENLQFWEENGLTDVTYQDLSPNAGSEDVFVLGNDLTYGGQASGEPYLAWITDRQGNVKHAWKHPGEIWSPLENREAFGDTWRSYTTGAHLYENGDLLISYQGVNVFPISMGLAKFDKDSNLLWKQNGFYHHWFSVGQNGNIYVPGTLIGQSPMKIADRQKEILCSDTQFPYDTVVILDQHGEVIKEIDLFESLLKSNLVGVINSTTIEPVSIQTCDPMHLNDIQVLTEELAPDYPSLSPGDLLLSFRSMNAIGVLDPETEKFKQFHVGTSQHQHSPRYFRDNQILVFDNYGGNVSEGTTRVMSIEVGSGQSNVIFPRPDVGHPDREFFSRVTGHIDIHPAKQRILVAFSEQGIVWEIDADTGKVLWEFVNTHTIQGRPGRVAVNTAKYADGYTFRMNGGQF